MSGSLAAFRLDARGLVKRYPGTLALDRADLRIEGGSIHGLLGKNGAGKSTLIKVLAGVTTPDEGDIFVNGKPVAITDPHKARDLGFIFAHQELADIPNLTVAENVMLGLGYPTRSGFVKRRLLRDRAAAVLDRLDAGIDPSAHLASLSLAERRLVTIARGLAADARLFVLDEPTASLTDREIEHLHRVLRLLRERGVAVTYVSHRLDEIIQLTDSVTVMLDGAAVFRGRTADLSPARLIELITGSTVPAETQIRGPVSKSAGELLKIRGLALPGRTEGVDFTLHEGEMLGVAGLVGAGRTELMRLIAGVDHAASGQITMHGSRVSIRTPRDALKAGIVLLPEDRKGEGAVLDFSIRKNITLPILPRFRAVRSVPIPSRRQEQRTAGELVERLKIKVADIEQPARFLSGGNQQKMVLAKWLDLGADVFIFDEPTQGIDVEGKAEVYELMSGLAERGKGIIFVSSEFSELVATCSRIMIMREGRIVSELAGDEIQEHEIVKACYRDPAA